MLGAGGEDWFRVSVAATECPRISAEFLEEERRAIGPLWFAQEYMGEFVDSGTAVFGRDLVERAVDDGLGPIEVWPMWQKNTATRSSATLAAAHAVYYFGLDLGSSGMTLGYRGGATDGPAEASGAGVSQLRVRIVERVPLGTPYPGVVARVREIVHSEILRDNARWWSMATGVGAPVVDMLRAARLGVQVIVPVTITGGERRIGRGRRGACRSRI